MPFVTSESPSRPRRRAGLVLAGVAALVAGLIGAGAPTAHADPVLLQPGELVVNGGAEQPVTVGWAGGLERHTHGASGYPASVVVNSSGLTGATFSGGIGLFNGQGGSSVATQTIDLTPSAAAIDNGNVDALLSAYIGGYSNQQDRASLSYAFRDGAAAPLATVTFGPVTAQDRANVSGFVAFAQTLRLPVGTRSVVLTITTQRFIAPANDGYLDNISLILDAPSPVANPDSETTLQGTPVTLDPPANDIPGAGAAIVPTSVRLLDGGVETLTMTTAQGSYVVDPATGDVLFTPVASFFGTTTPVPYRITDSSGQRAESILTIDVTFVSIPGLTVQKSASPADFQLGTEVTYSFVVTNTGNIPMNSIAIDDTVFTGSDPLPAAVCPASTLAPGAQTTCSTTYTLTAADVAAGGVSNTATATGVPDGSVVPFTSAPSSVSLPLTPVPAITLVKTVDAIGAIAAGDTIDYAFRVTNTGNVAVSTVGITEDTFTGSDPDPVASCPTTSLLPGQFVTCTASYALTQQDVDAATVSNTATAHAVPASGGTVASSPSSAALTITPRPALTLDKTADRTSITAVGQVVTYTFSVENTGNVTLLSPIISDSGFSGTGALGAISCPASTIVPGATLECTAAYTTTAADLEEVVLTNSATAGVETAGGALLASELSTVSTPIQPAPPVPSGGGPGALPVTGVDVATPMLTGLGLLLIGAALALSAALVRRQAARRTR